VISSHSKLECALMVKESEWIDGDTFPSQRYGLSSLSLRFLLCVLLF
jgi:hypothetical protein